LGLCWPRRGRWPFPSPRRPPAEIVLEGRFAPGGGIDGTRQRKEGRRRRTVCQDVQAGRPSKLCVCGIAEAKGKTGGEWAALARGAVGPSEKHSCRSSPPAHLNITDRLYDHPSSQHWQSCCRVVWRVRKSSWLLLTRARVRRRCSFHTHSLARRCVHPGDTSCKAVPPSLRAFCLRGRFWRCESLQSCARQDLRQGQLGLFVRAAATSAELSVIIDAADDVDDDDRG